jgi:hypothetical protein
MPRRTIDRETFTAGNRTTLRRHAGVRTTQQLINRARNAGVNLGRRRNMQEQRAFEWARIRYNQEVRQEQARTARERQIRQNITRQNQRIRNRVTSVNASISGLYQFLSANRGRRVGLRLIESDGEDVFTIRNQTYNIPTEDFHNWWKQKYYDWIPNSDETIFDRYPDAELYSYTPNRIITTRRIVQAFAEGVTNCLLTPILSWFEEQLENASSQKTKYRYSSLIKKTNRLLEEYPVSVPEEDIQKIADTLQIKIEIEFPLPNSVPFISVESTKKFLRTFKFINTRIDHLDIQRLVSDKPIVVTQEEINQIVEDDDGLLHYQKSNTGISAVYTLEGKYVLEDEYTDTVNRFENDTGMDKFKIDHINEPKLSNFVLQGVHYNGTIDYETVWENTEDAFEEDEYSLKDEHEIKHIDMKAAYTQYRLSKYYCGFMNNVHHFRKTDKVQGIGLWVVEDISYKNVDKNTRKHLETLKVYSNGQIYTTPDLKFLDDIGATYKVVAGAWSINPFHFDFNEDMLTKKFGKDEVPYYSRWTGSCNHISTEKRIFLRGGEEYYEAIKQTGVDCHFFQTGFAGREDDEILVTYPKNSMPHLSQITAYISAYTRLNVLEQLTRMRHESIVRVCVDGIYYRPIKFKGLCFDLDNLIHDYALELGNGFRLKKEKTFKNRPCSAYTSGFYDGNFEGSNKYRDGTTITEGHIGPGGGGKTHENLMDDGLQKVLYVAPPWKLARKKKEEYNANVNVWAKLLLDPQTTGIIKKKYNVIIADECSQMTEETKQAIIRTYGDFTLLIFCGDIGFQLPPCQGKEMNLNGLGKIVSYTENYRCQCKKLDKLLKYIREGIDAGYTDESIIEKTWEALSIRELPFTYETEDMILSPTHKGKDRWTAKYGSTQGLKLEIEKLELLKNPNRNDTNRLKVYKEALQEENRIEAVDKWFVRSVGKEYSTGEIVVGDKPSAVRSNLQHAFTVHSIQGETAYHKLILDKNEFTDARMLYTALSRAKRLDQIYLV